MKFWQRLDSLVHHLFPQPNRISAHLGWVCDRYDRWLGLTREEVGRDRPA